METYLEQAGGGGGGAVGFDLLSLRDLTGADEWGVDHDFLAAPAGPNDWNASFSGNIINELQYLRFSGGKLQGHFKGNGVDTGNFWVRKTFGVSIPACLWPAFMDAKRMNITPIGGAGNLDFFVYALEGTGFSEYARYRWALDGGLYDRGRLDYTLDRSSSSDWAAGAVNWGQSGVISVFAYEPATGFQHSQNSDNVALTPRGDTGYRGNGVDNGHQFSGDTILEFTTGLFFYQGGVVTREFQFEFDMWKILAPFA